MPEASATLTDNSVQPISRRIGLSYEAFVREYLYPLRPVIIKDSFPWGAFEKWSPEYFKTEFGTRCIPVRGQSMNVAELVDRIVHAVDDTPAPYLTGTGDRNYCLDLFPELAGDIAPVPEFILPNWLSERFLFPFLTRRLNRGPKAEIFFGGKGSGFPYIHWDSLHFHAFNTQVYGEKHWYLYAPDQSEFLYPTQPGDNKSLIDDVLNPDLQRFPMIEKATCHQGTLGPGEMLFIPAGWWHTTRMTGPSISIAMNAANSSNWTALTSDLVKWTRESLPPLAPAVKMYLNAIGRQKSRRDRKRHPFLLDCQTTTA